MGGQVDEFDSRAEASILIRANPNNLRIDLDGFHVLAQGDENGQIDPLSDPQSLAKGQHNPARAEIGGVAEAKSLGIVPPVFHGQI